MTAPTSFDTEVTAHLLPAIAEAQKTELTEKIEDFVTGTKTDPLFFQNQKVFTPRTRPLTYPDALQLARVRLDILPGLFPEDAEKLFEHRHIPVRGVDPSGLRSYLDEGLVSTLDKRRATTIQVLLIDKRVLEQDEDEHAAKKCHSSYMLPYAVCTVAALIALVFITALPFPQ